MDRRHTTEAFTKLTTKIVANYLIDLLWTSQAIANGEVPAQGRRGALGDVRVQWAFRGHTQT